MSTLDQIHESIDMHIAELRHEITALEAARAALLGESGNGNGGAVMIASGDGAGLDALPTTIESPRRRKAGQDRAARKPRSRARRKRGGSGQPVEVLLTGKLEAMLRESEDGLSAITIAKRASAGYGQVLALLRELEGAGAVRRSGTRRTSLWRLITDEERIAERAAELEALAG